MNGLETLLLQYGLAGLVIFVFYQLFKNELKCLREAIENLNKSILELRDIILLNRYKRKKGR